MVAHATKSFDEVAHEKLDALHAGRIPDDLRLCKIAWGCNAGASRVLLATADATSTRWLIEAIATWCGVDHKDDDEAGYHPSRYRDLLEKWPSLRRRQDWVLVRDGDGANLCLRGGYDETNDDTMTLHVVQKFGLAIAPWGADDRIEIAATMQHPSDVWALFLPIED